MSLQDARVAGDAVGLRRAGERVDLLVGRDRVVVVAELGGEDLLLASPPRRRCRGTSRRCPRRASTVAHVLAQVLGALLGRLEEAVLAGQQVGRREAVDQPRDRVGLLARRSAACRPSSVDPRAVVARSRSSPSAELRLEVEVGRSRRICLTHQSGCSKTKSCGVRPTKTRCLASKTCVAALGVEDPVGEQMRPRSSMSRIWPVASMYGSPRLRDDLGERRAGELRPSNSRPSIVSQRERRPRPRRSAMT